MSGEVTRREFVVGVSAVGGAVALCTAPGAEAFNRRAAESRTAVSFAAAGPSEVTVLLFDPEHAGACRKSAEAAEGCAKVALAGDRVRFAAQFFGRADAPARVDGLTSYADYIVLSGCAAEHGYRVIAEVARGDLTEWAVGRRAIV
jgi:hypothetical protein